MVAVTFIWRNGDQAGDRFEKITHREYSPGLPQMLKCEINSNGVMEGS